MSQLPFFQTPSEWVMPDGFPNLSGAREIAIDLETYDPKLKELGSGWPTKNGYIIGVAIAVENGAWYFPIRHQNGGNMDPEVVMRWMRRLCSDPDKDYIFHNAHYDVGWLRAEGVEVKGRIVDTMIAAPLIDENRFSYALNNLGRDYLADKKDERLLREAANEWGVDAKAEMYKLPPQYVGPYAEQDAALTLRLWHHFEGLMVKEEVTDIFNLELRVLKTTIDMRSRGVRVDLEGAERVRKDLEEKEKDLLSKIKLKYGLDVDIWAAASVAKVFDAASLPYPKTEATGAPSFTKEFLNTGTHYLPRAIVQAREFNKARTTFVETIMKHQHKGRIHADIHQLRSDGGGTITGRFCVHADTVLDLDTGSVRIGDYDPSGGERILTHTGEWHRVLRRIYKGEEEMYCLRVSSGDSIKCTGSHRVLTPSGWKSVKDLSEKDPILHVSFEDVSKGRRVLSSGGRILPVPIKANGLTSSGASENYRAEHKRGAERAPIKKGTSLGERVAVLPIQNGGQEPYVGQDRRDSSQLQGGSVLRSGGLRPCSKAEVVHKPRIEACVPTFGGDVQSSGDIRDSGGDARSPHRWGQDQQRPFEPCVSDSIRASAYTRTVTVEAIESVGIASVWDIEVETDHSYVAHGLIHHNSYSSPNLQQLPARNEVIGPMIRSLFLPEEGDKWGSFDYSSQEPRIVVHYASLLEFRGASEFVEKYREDKYSDFHQIAADIVGVPRKQAKTINLGLFYGMGVTKLAAQLGLELSDAKDLFAKYHAEVPFVREMSEFAANRAGKKGSIRTLLGRKCRYEKWEPALFGVHKPLSHKEAFETYGNGIRRAFTYKALNALIQGSAADQTKMAMVLLAEEGMLPLVQIHDELAMSVPDEATARRIQEIMETCVTLQVPSVVDAEIGPSWGEASKSISDAWR